MQTQTPKKRPVPEPIQHGNCLGGLHISRSKTAPILRSGETEPDPERCVVPIDRALSTVTYLAHLGDLPEGLSGRSGEPKEYSPENAPPLAGAAAHGSSQHCGPLECDQHLRWGEPGAQSIGRVQRHRQLAAVPAVRSHTKRTTPTRPVQRKRARGTPRRKQPASAHSQTAAPSQPPHPSTQHAHAATRRSDRRKQSRRCSGSVS